MKKGAIITAAVVIGLVVLLAVFLGIAKVAEGMGKDLGFDQLTNWGAVYMEVQEDSVGERFYLNPTNGMCKTNNDNNAIGTNTIIEGDGKGSAFEGDNRAVISVIRDCGNCAHSVLGCNNGQTLESSSSGIPVDILLGYVNLGGTTGLGFDVSYNNGIELSKDLTGNQNDKTAKFFKEFSGPTSVENVHIGANTAVDDFYAIGFVKSTVEDSDVPMPKYLIMSGCVDKNPSEDNPETKNCEKCETSLTSNKCPTSKTFPISEVIKKPRLLLIKIDSKMGNAYVDIYYELDKKDLRALAETEVIDNDLIGDGIYMVKVGDAMLSSNGYKIQVVTNGINSVDKTVKFLITKAGCSYEDPTIELNKNKNIACDGKPGVTIKVENIYSDNVNSARIKITSDEDKFTARFDCGLNGVGYFWKYYNPSDLPLERGISKIVVRTDNSALPLNHIEAKLYYIPEE